MYSKSLVEQLLLLLSYELIQRDSVLRINLRLSRVLSWPGAARSLLGPSAPFKIFHGKRLSILLILVQFRVCFHNGFHLIFDGGEVAYTRAVHSAVHIAESDDFLDFIVKILLFFFQTFSVVLVFLVVFAWIWGGFETLLLQPFIIIFLIFLIYDVFDGNCLKSV
jgi:hypothetical protein